MTLTDSILTTKKWRNIWINYRAIINKYFILKTIPFLAHDEPPEWTLQPFTFLSLQPLPTRLSCIYLRPHPCLNSDDSFRAVFDSNSTLDNGAIDKPNDFLYSKPRAASFLQPPLQPINSITPVVNSTSSSSNTDATPVLSPLSSHESDDPSPMADDQLEHDLDNFINIRQQIRNFNNPLFNHQLTHSISTTLSFKSSTRNAPTSAHHRNIFINSKYKTPYFLLHGILCNYDPVSRK